MKKFFVLFALALLLIFTMTACDEIFKPSNEITEKGSTEVITKHTHTEVVDDAVAPTCTQTGLTEGKHCEDCGKILVAQETIAASHSWDNGTIITQPTCTEKGVKTFACANCNETKIEEVAATGIHIYDEEDKCNMCKALYPYTVGLEFELLPDGNSYTVYGIGAATDIYIAIPRTYEGLPVTQIDESAFQNNTTITGVRIPNTVIVIGNEAFYNCSHLRSIIIPDSVTTVGEQAFCYCSSLTSITIPDGVTKIGDFAFHFCDRLTSVTFGEDSQLTSIGRSTFSGCSSLESIEIPDGVTSIVDYAFCNCWNLTSVTIPDSVTNIGIEAFTGIGAIKTEQRVDYVDTWVVSVDNSRSLVNIKAGTKGIAAYAFYGRDRLKSVTIPESVISIGDDAFSGCSGLTSITFTGTTAQWNAINKGNDWVPTSDTYTIYCTDGNITK